MLLLDSLVSIKKVYYYDIKFNSNFVLAIVDIGSASFKYDMRRLTEILAFPRAWYRRSIVRRLFLGDLTRTVPNSVYSDPSNNMDPENSLVNSKLNLNIFFYFLFFFIGMEILLAIQKRNLVVINSI